MSGEKTAAVDPKVVEEKMDKGEALTPEEETFLLKEEPAVEGYKPPIAEPASPAKEETPAAEKPEDKVKPVPPVDDKPKTPSTEENIFVRLERELSKPDGQENLEGWTPSEKAYYHQMRRDRKARQQAEVERDLSRRNELKLKKQLDEAAKKDKASTLEELKKKDASDFMTVGDVIKLIETEPKVQDTESKETPEDKPAEKPAGPEPMQMRYLRMCDTEARTQFKDDYDTVMELTEDIINNNPEHLKSIAMTIQAGENPAVKTYQLIKADPEFQKLLPLAETRAAARKEKKPEDKAAEKTPDKKSETAPAKPAVKTEKEKRAEEAEKKLEINSKKPKTTGAVDTSSSEHSEGELTLEDIAKMSDMEFAKLPKATRKKYLELYGT